MKGTGGVHTTHGAEGRQLLQVGTQGCGLRRGHQQCIIDPMKNCQEGQEIPKSDLCEVQGVSERRYSSALAALLGPKSPTPSESPEPFLMTLFP